MREFTIGKNDAGQRLDRWLGKTLPLLPAPLAQKYIRLKRVKVNGRGSQRDVRLREGDLLQLYINDEFFDQPREDNAFLAVFRPRLDVVYEDENLMLLNKRPGLLCHADEHEKVNTLTPTSRPTSTRKRSGTPGTSTPSPPPCATASTATPGASSWRPRTPRPCAFLNQKIRDREIAKRYLAVIHGRMDPPRGKLEGFLLKDEDRAQVKVFSRPVPGGRSAATLYRTLQTRNGLSLVECELLTGRTHQIRAQFAAAGHPLLGDGKYGRGRDNKKYGRAFQALYSYQLEFTFPPPPASWSTCGAGSLPWGTWISSGSTSPEAGAFSPGGRAPRP